MKHMGTLVKEDENYWYIRLARIDGARRFPKPKRVKELMRQIDERGMLGALEPETFQRLVELRNPSGDQLD